MTQNLRISNKNFPRSQVFCNNHVNSSANAAIYKQFHACFVIGNFLLEKSIKINLTYYLNKILCAFCLHFKRLRLNRAFKIRIVRKNWMTGKKNGGSFITGIKKT
jgi:hypothetical protein